MGRVIDMEVTPPRYPVSEADARDVTRRFTYVPPRAEQVPRYRIIRELGLDFANNILENCAPSRERSLALTKLEETVMWANAAIARNE